MISIVCTLMVSLAQLLMQPDSATIIFAGDAMQHKSQLDAAKKSDGSYDFTSCFSAVAPYIREADLAVVNLETPLGGAPYSGYPMFCAPDSYLDALTDAGFDFFLGANNHALDRRDRGVRRTVEQFEKRDLPYAGIFRNKTSRDSIMPRIMNVNGFRIAFLNYTYGTNGIDIREDVIVDPINTNLIDQDIEEARNAGAEILAVCLHWGDEYQLLPNRRQKQLAEHLRQQGVQLIIGSHPHVIQPMEFTTDSTDVTRNCFLVYSLGNFISGMRTTDTRGGATARIKLMRDRHGRAYVDNADYRLFFTITPPYPGSDGNFRLVPAETPLMRGSTAEHQRNAFVRSATGIFEKHNIAVPRDTATITVSDPLY